MPRPENLHWLVSSCCVILAGLIFSLTLAPGAIASPAYFVVNQALFIALVTYLLFPAANNLKVAAVNSTISVLLFILLSRLPVASALPVANLFQVCIVIFSLGLTLYSLTQLLEHIFSAAKNIRIPVILMTAVIASAPVWMGPVVDIYRLDNFVINGVISFSPLTHFSVAAEYDFLRSEWMYRNSAFGSLPFVYPGINSIVSYYFLVVIILRFILWRLTQKSAFEINNIAS